MSAKVAKIGEMTNPELDECTKLDELFGQNLTLKGSHNIQVGANPCAIIETEEKGKVSSFSKVILDQLDKMKPEFEKGSVFKVKAVKKKNYYMFEDQ